MFINPPDAPEIKCPYLTDEAQCTRFGDATTKYNCKSCSISQMPDETKYMVLVQKGVIPQTIDVLSAKQTLPASSAACTHRGDSEGTCSCGALKYRCNLIGITVRTRARPGHPHDIVCDPPTCRALQAVNSSPP